MFTYASILTAVTFFVLGVIAALTHEAWLDGKSIAEHRRKAAAARKARQTTDLEDETDRAMDEAVALVSDELGGEVIAIDRQQS